MPTGSFFTPTGQKHFNLHWTPLSPPSLHSSSGGFSISVNVSFVPLLAQDIIIEVTFDYHIQSISKSFKLYLQTMTGHG
jgi:hypothetical protein